MIRFQPDHALWRADNLPFRLQFFHRGFYYTNRVDIFEVNQGLAAPIVYSPAMFNFGDQPVPDIKDTNLGFAGFRIHGPINRPDYFDEIGVFLGASYFRAVAKGQIYGFSARGLSINYRRSKGRGIPDLQDILGRAAAKGASSIVVHALLDSESAAAAYRFTIRPGDTTVYDIEVALFPRVNIEQPGLATLTSMFFFGRATASASTISAPPCMTPTALRSQKRPRRADLAHGEQSDRSAGQAFVDSNRAALG